MKRKTGMIMAIVIGIALAASAGMAKDMKYSGFLDGYYDKLQPGPKDGAKERWLKPGVDYAKYKKVMIDSVIFYYADKSEDKGIDGNEMKELSDAFNLEFVNAMKGGYTIVSEPGPDVLRLRTAITNIKKSKPVRSAISSVVPVSLGISIVKKGATSSWTGSGSTAAEFMAMDSVSGEVVAAAVDERSAGFTERFSELGSAKDAFKFWALRIRTVFDKIKPLDNLRTEEPKEK